MVNHFINNNNKNPNISIAVFILASILTFGFGFVFFYDPLMEPMYYINRKRLINYLKTNKVTLELINSASKNDLSAMVMKDIVDYKLFIDGTEYQLWVWGGTKVTVSDKNLNIELIGLFTSSPISKKQNKQLIKLIGEKTFAN